MLFEMAEAFFYTQGLAKDQALRGLTGITRVGSRVRSNEPVLKS